MILEFQRVWKNFFEIYYNATLEFHSDINEKNELGHSYQIFSSRFLQEQFFHPF